MAPIEKAAVSNRDPASVRSFLIARENAPQIVPNLRRVWDITPAEAGLDQRRKSESQVNDILANLEAQLG